MGIGFLSPVQVFYGCILICISFLVLSGNLCSISLLRGMNTDFPCHIPGNRNTLFCFPVIFRIFPNTAGHLIDPVADFLIRPPVIGVFPLIAGMFNLRCTKIFQSPVDRLCCRCLLFPLFCSSHHDFIGFLLPVDTSLAHGFQAICSHCDQCRNIHIFTNYAVLNFKLRSRRQVVAIPVGMIIFIFFQNAVHLLLYFRLVVFSGKRLCR